MFLFSAQKPGSYDHIIINDDLEKAYQEIRNILIDVSIFYCKDCKVQKFSHDLIFCNFSIYELLASS